MFRVLEYREWMTETRLTLKPAVDQDKHECIRCGLCCSIRPCIPTPDEIRKIAKYLDLNLKAMIQSHFVGDNHGYWGGPSFIFPAKDSQRDITGTYISANRTYDQGHCIFYDPDEHSCGVYPVRPEAARQHKCWDVTRGATEKAVDAWRDENISEWGITYPDYE